MSVHQPFVRISLAVTIICSFAVSSAVTPAQTSAEKVDVDAINKIKDEAMRRSQVMDTVEYLTDVIGPRLTGSPGLKLKATRWI